MAPFGAWHPSPRAAPPNVWQVVDLPAPEGPLDQPTEELIARIQAELDEAARKVDAQMSSDAKAARSSFVLDNSSTRAQLKERIAKELLPWLLPTPTVGR